MSKYVKIAQPMPTPSLTNQENLQHLDLRPMIAATQTEVQYVFYDETRSPFFNLHMRHELSPRFARVQIRVPLLVVITTVHSSGI